MKREAFLINAARGALIDEGALYTALKEGWIAGAGLDVLSTDAPPKDHPLFSLDNVIVTPHVAFFSQEALLELERRAAGEVARVLMGRRPENLVNPEALPRARARIREGDGP